MTFFGIIVLFPLPEHKNILFFEGQLSILLSYLLTYLLSYLLTSSQSRGHGALPRGPRRRPDAARGRALHRHGSAYIIRIRIVI